MALEKAVEASTYDPGAYMLLVPFGGQLEPKINRELMANGISVQRAVVDTNGALDLSGLDLDRARGIVLSGGNDSIYEEGARTVPEDLLNLNIPILGICYGQQAIVHRLGGQVEPGQSGEHGVVNVSIDTSSPLFKGIGSPVIRALMNHVDSVVSLPKGFRSIAESPAGIAGATDGSKTYLVQFHPESSQTEHGTNVLLNFATEVCQLQPEPDFTEATYRERVTRQSTDIIQRKLGRSKTRTILFDSGGVDSATAHALVNRDLKAINLEDTVTGIYVDTGMMRHEDGDTINLLRSQGYQIETSDWSEFFLHGRVPLPTEEAKKRGYSYLPPMDSVTDPRVMRQIVKYGFIEVQRRIGVGLRSQYPDAETIALVQGTNLTDKIESGDFSGDQIKEHHNSGIEPFVDVLVEPLSSLFKGDIRKIAEELGLPPEVIYRQPFPGPGLCLRLPANSTGETLWPDDIDEKRLRLEEVWKRLGSQAMTAFWLPFEATGQKGDSRVHGSTVAIFGVYDPELIQKLAFDVPANTPATRVLYTPDDLDPDSVSGIYQMVNETYLAPLKNAEALKSNVVSESGLAAELSQHYAASLPITFGGVNLPTLMLRMFRTGISSGLEDYIDGEAALGGLNVDMGSFSQTLDKVTTAAPTLGFGSKVLLDVTSKPPGTVELV